MEKMKTKKIEVSPRVRMVFGNCNYHALRERLKRDIVDTTEYTIRRLEIMRQIAMNTPKETFGYDNMDAVRLEVDNLIAVLELLSNEH